VERAGELYTFHRSLQSTHLVGTMRDNWIVPNALLHPLSRHRQFVFLLPPHLLRAPLVCRSLLYDKKSSKPVTVSLFHRGPR